MRKLQNQGCPTIDELHCPDNTTTSCGTEMAELFNNYFTSVFTHEELSTIPVLQLETQPPLIGPLHITPELVLGNLTNLKSGKSPGPHDSIN